MANTASVNFNITNLSFSIASLLRGVSFVEGITKRGPISKTDLLINSWPQFERVYGGYISNSDFPLLCKRAMDRGAILRVNRVVHYTDPTDGTTFTATKPTIRNVVKLTFSAALITANSVAVSLNGIAITPVVFATDSDTTMAAIATAIAGLSNVSSAVVVPVAAATDNDREIIIYLNTNAAVTVVAAVTLGASQATITNATLTNICNSAGVSLFSVASKYYGADYNYLTVSILPASNGIADYFNLSISHSVEAELNEVYANLKIPGNPTALTSTFLDDVNKASQLATFSYLDLSALTAPIRPVNGVYRFGGATNGGAVVNADYIGDVTGKTGFYAFDTVDDALQLAAPEISDMAIHTAGSAYAAARKDLVYFAHLSNSLVTAADLVTERSSTNIDSVYTAFYGGGLKITDPVSGLEKEISELGDVLGISAYSDSVGAPWYSMANFVRGFIPNALGVVNNFGATALYNDLNQLANRQINMVIGRDNRLFLSGNFTGVLANSKLSFLNTVRFLIWLQKSLRPSLNRYLEEPNDIPTFKAIFREVEPFFRTLVVDRALFDWKWDGDQDITDITKVVVNNTTDLDNGKYKVRLWLKIIPTMQEITIDIVVAPTGTDFTLVNN